MTRFIILMAFIAASCGSTKKDNSEDHHHEEHGGGGIVVLNERQRDALQLQLGTFQMRNMTTVIKTNGVLEVPPASSAEVTAVIGGNVKEIKVFHGDKVQKGQILAILEHPDYITLQEEFTEMANRLEFLENEYNRQKQLFENKVGAGKDYQQARADYYTAKARYEGLKSRLELINLDPEKVSEGIISRSVNVTSPISGYVNEVKIKVGTYIDAKDILYTISDHNAIHADFLVYEKDVHLLKPGQKVNFTVSNRRGEELMATIFAIGREFEPNTRAVHIHARLDKNPGDLIPGMYVSGQIHTDQNYTQTLPTGAVVSEGTKSFIFVRDVHALENMEAEEHSHDDGESEEEHEHGENPIAFKMVEVITGKSDEGYIEVNVLEHLPEDTQIVLNAAYYLLADMKKEDTAHEH